MKFVAIAYLLIVLTLIIGAVYLICHDKGGWGWFLLIAFLMLAGFEYKEKTQKHDD